MKGSESWRKNNDLTKVVIGCLAQSLLILFVILQARRTVLVLWELGRNRSHTPSLLTCFASIQGLYIWMGCIFSCSVTVARDDWAY